MHENELSRIIIGCGIKVHQSLGPGLLERAYMECFKYELKKSGMHVQEQKTIPIIYDGKTFTSVYKIDLLVENKVVIEIKSAEFISDLHIAQTLTYLRLGNYRLGLIMNFNSILLKDGIKRLVNGL